MIGATEQRSNKNAAGRCYQHPSTANPENWSKQLTGLVSILPQLLWCLKMSVRSSLPFGGGDRFLLPLALQPRAGCFGTLLVRATAIEELQMKNHRLNSFTINELNNLSTHIISYPQNAPGKNISSSQKQRSSSIIYIDVNLQHLLVAILKTSLKYHAETHKFFL